MDKQEFVTKRIDKLREKMQQENLQAVIIEKPENVMYLSNFNPVINSHSAFVVMRVDEEPCLLVHSIRYAHALEEGNIANIKLYGRWGDNIPLADTPEEAIKIILGNINGKIGMELSYVNVKRYLEVDKKIQPETIVSISELIDMMKIIKDEYEIACIRKSAAFVDLGVRTTIEYLEKGYSEAEASTEGQYAMRKLWHSKYRNHEVCGFGTSEGGMIDSLHVWCLSNEHIAYGCDCPRHYYPRKGDLVLPMAWAKTDGYHAENERTIIIGSLDTFKQKAYDSMLKARESIFNILKPGIMFKDLYNAAAKVYGDCGFAKILPGRVGHGVGCSAHEFPSLAPHNSLLLEAGMVITVEPGLMDKNWGGVRHSDTVLITDDGFELLTKLDRGLIKININA